MTYVGEWLPEPLLTDPSASNPAEQAQLADSLSMAFLLMLERLTPVQRAVFLLHDVFAYGYDELADRFLAAMREGDMDGLVSMLAEDRFLRHLLTEL